MELNIHIIYPHFVVMKTIFKNWKQSATSAKRTAPASQRTSMSEMGVWCERVRRSRVRSQNRKQTYDSASIAHFVFVEWKFVCRMSKWDVYRKIIDKRSAHTELVRECLRMKIAQVIHIVVSMFRLAWFRWQTTNYRFCFGQFNFGIRKCRNGLSMYGEQWRHQSKALR